MKRSRPYDGRPRKKEHRQEILKTGLQRNYLPNVSYSRVNKAVSKGVLKVKI